jgi:hypothetical protein
MFLLSKTSRPVLGPNQPPIQWVPGSFPGVKQPDHQVDHSAPSSIKVKISGLCIYSPVRLRRVDTKKLTFFTFMQSVRYFVPLYLQWFHIFLKFSNIQLQKISFSRYMRTDGRTEVETLREALQGCERT